MLAGGLSAADTSTSEVDIADLHHIVHSGTLPGAQHDAQGAGLAQGAYVFGGGSLAELDHILKVDPATASVTTAGRLPSPSSDVAVTQVGATAYIVGGYDGTSFNTVLAFTPAAASGSSDTCPWPALRRGDPRPDRPDPRNRRHHPDRHQP